MAQYEDPDKPLNDPLHFGRARYAEPEFSDKQKNLSKMLAETMDRWITEDQAMARVMLDVSIGKISGYTMKLNEGVAITLPITPGQFFIRNDSDTPLVVNGSVDGKTVLPPGAKQKFDVTAPKIDPKLIERGAKAIYDSWDRKLDDMDTCRTIAREVLEAVMG